MFSQNLVLWVSWNQPLNGQPYRLR